MLPGVCLVDREIDQDHSESTQHRGDYRTDECSRGVSLTSNFNTNQLNPFSAHMYG